MTEFRVGYKQTEYRTCRVEAATADEAAKKALEGDCLDDNFDLAEDGEVTFVEEVVDLGEGRERLISHREG